MISTAITGQTEALSNERFISDIMSNRNNRQILQRWEELALPDAMLVAGCLFQTVWNLRSGQPAEAGIKDYDLFYYDPDDLTAEAEQAVQTKAERLFAELGITIEVANQARVHLWYESCFGYHCEPLVGTCDGIDHFLIPATCVGISPQAVYVPNGLDMLYQGLLAPNPLRPHHDLFLSKAQSYRQRWPWLSISTAQPSAADKNLSDRLPAA